MRNGVLRGVSKDDLNVMVSVKDIDGAWKKHSARFIDVAGDAGKEAVVIVSVHAGGSASWPNYVFVYDARGKLLMKWDSGRYHGDAREAVSFGPVTPTSAILRVSHIPKGNECYMCGTGKAAWRISKKNGRPTMVRTAWR